MSARQLGERPRVGSNIGACGEAAETLILLAEQRGIAIETSGDTTPTTGSHALLQQLTTNLVHNAIVPRVTVQLPAAPPHPRGVYQEANGAAKPA